MATDIEVMLDLMDKTFLDFEQAIPKPKVIRLSFGLAYRYEEKDIYQAIIQKLARVQSSVRAAQLLLNHGFVQEQAILHRTIDETNEDIEFLVYAVTNDTITDLHKRFLDAFWQEEIDESGTMIDSRQKRPMIKRAKIQAYLANLEGVDIDPHSQLETAKTLSKVYSGYVHGASPHIMDMYVGEPPHFHTKGMIGTIRMKEHADDLWNYIYRSFQSHIMVAKALGAEQHLMQLTKCLNEIKRAAGYS